MHPYRIAVLYWDQDDGIAKLLTDELARLNLAPVPFRLDAPIPEQVDVLFTYGPYGKTLPVWQQAASRKSGRPIVVHWNTEGMPDIRIPPGLMRALGQYRSHLGRLENADSPLLRFLAKTYVIRHLDRIFNRWRYVGDYHYAFRRQWLHLLADSSQVYAALRTQAGIPTFYLPWGSTPEWHADLHLKRDIDVLWLGKRASARRSAILDRVVSDLRAHGAVVHVADNEESPFIFGNERTAYLNRAKITLNITRTWYDDNFSRFVMAASNRSLIVSEPMLPHCPQFLPGVHYVSTQIPKLSETILYYLEHEQVARPIIENAYRLSTQQLTFANHMQRLLDTIMCCRQAHADLTDCSHDTCLVDLESSCSLVGNMEGSG